MQEEHNIQATGAMNPNQELDQEQAADMSDIQQSPEPQQVSDEHDDFMDDDDLDSSAKQEVHPMQTLLDANTTSLEAGQVVKGTIVRLVDSDVIMDVGSKAEGVVPLEEFSAGGERDNLEVGQTYDVLVVRVEGPEGAPQLSRRQARQQVAQTTIESAFRSCTPIAAKVVDLTKGGLKLDIDGISAFMPFSHTGVPRKQSHLLKKMVGTEITGVVLEMPTGKDPIMSRRQYEDQRRKEVLDNLEVGSIVNGVVKHLTSFGAFIDLGGMDGLLHVKDMAWQHINQPSDLLKEGEEVEVMVIKKSESKIGLGLKHKTPDPWLAAAEKYPQGAQVEGRVTNLTDYGAFVELEPGLDGLIRISEMSWTKFLKHPSEVLNVGEVIQVEVLEIDLEKKKISLGYKQTQADPWNSVITDYPVGAIVEGVVADVKDFGVFVQLNEGIEGIVRTQDLSWAKDTRRPNDIVHQGDKVQCKVLEIDLDKRRLRLGLKQVSGDPWQDAQHKYTKNTVVTGTVVKLTDFGAFVELEPGIEGLLHISEMSNERIASPADVVREGQTIEAKVVKADWNNQKIALSIREHSSDIEQAEIQSYQDPDSSQTASLSGFGELLNQAIREKQISGFEEETPPAEPVPASVEPCSAEEPTPCCDQTDEQPPCCSETTDASATESSQDEPQPAEPEPVKHSESVDETTTT